MVENIIKRRSVSAIKSTALDLLRRYRVRPNHRQGQNFLIDDSVYEDIIRAAKLSPEDVVLEIGAGLGTLTERLSPLVKRVMAVELDHRLAAILRHRLSPFHNIEIIEKNILAVSVSDLGLNQPYKVVANIPYNITGAIFKKFLMQDLQPVAMTVLVQREVGERIVAKSGKMSLLALSIQLYATPVLIRHVLASSFYPTPEVDSVILNVLNIHSFPFSDVDEKFFWRVARVGFSSRRKQLHNNLSASLNIPAIAASNALKEAELSPAVRAENLAVVDWHNLAQALRPLLT
ncbi:MAG: Ribosomal RNA small subunit methyltransferase A [Parcubacteria group bacterium GW2011_GWA2_46_9]|nr:MAG: Ribosomal RNA small subunit methyltransferase A [Parcubacteria group bacterium GW2011_GWA2_46_9]